MHPIRLRAVAALGLVAILAVACGTTDAAEAQPLTGTSPASISLGQADPTNMGGTRAPAAGLSLGQADPANMGGTRAPAAGNSLGQADPANMGGTRAPAGSPR